MTDRLTSEKRSENMRKIKSHDTKIEMILRTELWKMGFRYRKNYKKICGKPDIVFLRKKIAIFCDSEFWHGKDWTGNNSVFGTNTDFWVNKIEQNIKRDNFVNHQLTIEGWKVLRFWGNDIKKNLRNCIEIIKSELNNDK